ncbi:hypothetical protein M3J09_007440 [Ascochyta lentis]
MWKDMHGMTSMLPALHRNHSV